MTPDEIRDLADEMLQMGTGVAMVKCGCRGLYVKTANAERLSRFGAAKPADMTNWADRELWLPVYQEEKFVGALGSGDSAIAGFLAAFVRGCTIEDCLRYGNAAGSMNVTVPDGLSWNGTMHKSEKHADQVLKVARSQSAAALSPVAASWRRSLLNHHLDPEESDCRSIEQSDLETRLPGCPITVISPNDALGKIVEQKRSGREIWREMLIIAIGLLLAELILARLFLQSATRNETH